MLGECIALEPIYRPAEVLGPQAGPSVVNNNVRKNEVVYLDTVFQKNEQKSKILQLVLKNGLFGDVARKVWADGNTGFELINQCTRGETVLSRYGHTDFYGFHRDYNFNRANRLITAVYYCNLEPEVFSGGALAFKSDKPFSVQPKHNRLVVFNSGAYHAVEPVTLASNEFKDGRFSVNMWIGFQS